MSTSTEEGGKPLIHSFEVILEGVDFGTVESTDADALFQTGCGDSLPCQNGPVSRLLFDREAASFATAVSSALLAIESALPHARIMRVERLTDMEEASLPQSA